MYLVFGIIKTLLYRYCDILCSWYTVARSAYTIEHFLNISQKDIKVIWVLEVFSIEYLNWSKNKISWGLSMELNLFCSYLMQKFDEISLK